MIGTFVINELKYNSNFLKQNIIQNLENKFSTHLCKIYTSLEVTKGFRLLFFFYYSRIPFMKKVMNQKFQHIN